MIFKYIHMYVYTIYIYIYSLIYMYTAYTYSGKVLDTATLAVVYLDHVDDIATGTHAQKSICIFHAAAS